MLSGHAPPQLLPRRDVLRHRFSDVELAAHVGRLGGTPPELLAQPGLVQHLLRPLRADFEVLETYEPLPMPPLDCPLLVCAARDDPAAEHAAMPQWRDNSRGAFELRSFDGGHFYLMAQPQAFAGAVLQWLDRQHCAAAAARPAVFIPV